MHRDPPPSTVRASRAQVRSVFSHVLLCAVSAGLLGLAFPHPGWSWVAYIALVPVGVLIARSRKPVRMAAAAYVVSLAWWVLRMMWLAPVTMGGYLTLSAYMALYLPATLVLAWWLTRRYRLPLVLVLPAAWVSLELIRGWVLAGGFGWFALSHTQAPYSPRHEVGRVIQVADLFGEHTVSFVIAMFNGMVIDVLTRPWVAPMRRRRRGWFITAKHSLVAGLVVMIAAWSYGYYRLKPANIPYHGSLNVAVVQTNVPQDNKIHPTAEQQAEDWQTLINLTGSAVAATPKPQLIVWPETMVPAALNQESLAFYATTDTGWRNLRAYPQRIGQLAAEHGVALMVGAHAYLDWGTVTDTKTGQTYTAPRRRYNATYLFHPDGTRDAHRYDKTHRVPFGEYIPWVDGWPWLKKQFIKHLSPYDFDYTLQPGKTDAPFTLTNPAAAALTDKGPLLIRLAASICFEDAVPRVARRAVYAEDGRKKADVLVNLTNDGWYPGLALRPQHLQIAVYRSIENRVPTARSVNTGLSGFIDSSGRIGPLAHTNNSTQKVTAVASHTVRFDGRSTLFGRVGHTPMVLLAATTLLAAFVGVVIPRRR